MSRNMRVQTPTGLPELPQKQTPSQVRPRGRRQLTAITHRRDTRERRCCRSRGPLVTQGADDEAGWRPGGPCAPGRAPPRAAGPPCGPRPVPWGPPGGPRGPQLGELQSPHFMAARRWLRSIDHGQQHSEPWVTLCTPGARPAAAGSPRPAQSDVFRAVIADSAPPSWPEARRRLQLPPMAVIRDPSHPMGEPSGWPGPHLGVR
jgi:hypothetical protein